MTLSRWLRDYVYIPLGGSAAGGSSPPEPPVTMLIGGLWHGAGWTFVVWGGSTGSRSSPSAGGAIAGYSPPATAWSRAESAL